jgi:DNA topoisomerase-3
MLEFASAKVVRQTERNMVAVCQGTKSKNDMIVEAVEQYKDMFVRAKANFEKVTSVLLS